MSNLVQKVPSLPMSRVDPYEKQVTFGTPDSYTSCCGICNPMATKKFSHEETMKRVEEIIRRRD